MRLLLLLSLLGTSSLRVCGEDDAPEAMNAPPTSSAEAEAEVAVAIEPAHGGVIVQVEEQPIELVIDQEGDVKAYPVGELELDLEAPVVARIEARGGPRQLELVWDPEAACFHGQLEVRPRPGPIELGIMIEGRVRRGQLRRLRPIRPRVRVVAPRAEVELEAPAPPEVHIEVPSPSVRIELGGGLDLRHGHRRRGHGGMRGGMRGGMHRGGMHRGWMKGHYRR